MLHSQSRISQAHPQIERIIEINEPTVEVHVKQRIKQKLIQDAEFLLQKKKKEQEKRDKMRKVEEDLERQRQMKLRMIIEKKNKSDRVMEMNRDAHSKKIKQQQDYFNQVLNVHKTKEERQMQDALIRQKQLKKQLSKSTVRSKHEKTLTTLDATFNTSQYNQKQAYFDRLSQQLQQKSLKAIRNHEKQTKQIIDRMKQKSENITTVQQKANNISLQQKMQNVQKWNKKVENIESFHEQTKLERQKKLLQRRQSFKYKLDKCNQNLQQLSFREQEKYEKLQEKLEKQNMEEKEWRDSRLEKYWKLWEENSQKIEEQKRENAERILHKHQQITEQNRVYKSRKEKLIQVVKKIGQ